MENIKSNCIICEKIIRTDEILDICNSKKCKIIYHNIAIKELGLALSNSNMNSDYYYKRIKELEYDLQE